jgi:hypothetical protein
MGRLGSTTGDGCRPLGEHLLGAWVAFGDGTALADAPAQVAGLTPGDGLSLSDAATRAAGLAPADGLDVGDALARAWAAVLARTDGLTLSDAAMRAAGLAPTDGVDVGDALTASWGAILALADGIQCSDAPARTVSIAPVDGVTLAETVVAGIIPTLLIELRSEADEAITGVTVYLVQSDTMPGLLFSFSSGGVVWDIDEDAMVRFQMRVRDADAGDYTADGECRKTPAGYWYYRLSAVDTTQVGEFYARLVVQLSAVSPYSSELFLVRIREKL